MFGNNSTSPISHAEFGEFTQLQGEAVRGRNRVTDYFYDYWLTKHEGDKLPCRADIRPNDLSRHLDHVVIMDVATETRFRLTVRLIGTHVSNFYGEITGKDIREMTNQQAAERIYLVSQRVVDERLPILTITPAFARDRQYLEAYALYLPLYNTAAEVEKILVAVDIRSLYR
ncbi:PAS domain-containing protein [Kordiimonas sp.]|uniref:PAS domain-containing protein n=1 Tax=Kordiimonas sp. TaxID=1970157 RepID=UPI003A90DFE0